ncbi:MAG: hypothetical protein ACFFD2_20545 [Promethearchaeota archaeon]
MSRSVKIKFKPQYFLPATIYAATRSDSFSEGIPYPLFHSLIYFLEHNGIESGYEFNWYFFLKEDLARVGITEDFSKDVLGYPNSSELAEDVYDLAAAQMIDTVRGSGLIIKPGSSFLDNVDAFIDKFERESKLSLEDLKILSNVALKNVKELLTMCYKWYINEV